MRFSMATAGLAALAATADAQTGPGSYCDQLGRCFQSFTNSAGIKWGFAIPETSAVPFRTILQVTAPKSVGWAGLGWGGAMVYNPLALTWANGDKVVISSRVAVGYNMPRPYADVKYTLLDGSYVNSTHFVTTVVCEGCSDWTALAGAGSTLNPNGANPMVYAYSNTKPQTPSDPASLFSIHDDVGSWSQNLASAKSSKFDEWAGGSSAPPAPTGAPAPTTASSQPAPSSTRAPVPVPSSCNMQANFPLQAASGWRFVKVAGSLQTPRGVVVDSAGNLLIVESGKGVTVHTVGSNGCISSSKTLINDIGLNHGITLTPDGKQLVVSSMTTATRYSYDAAAQTVSNQQVVVNSIQRATHATRTVVIPPANPNLLIVACGSDGNLDMGSVSPSVARAAVKVFDLTTVPQGGHNYLSGGKMMGYGLRNEIAIVPDKNKMIWGVENSADEFKRTVNGQSYDIHENNPAEELNFLGDPANPTSKWYGYPTCFTVWGGQQFPDKQMATGAQFLPAPNSSYTDATCEQQSTPPRLSIQAHSAPIDGKFDSAGANMYVSLHGSWNRQQPTGYKVIEIPFSDGQGGYGPTAAANSVSGYRDILWDTTQGCSMFNCFRPTGVAWDRDFTRMYVASDNAQQGELYILVKG